MVIAVIAILVAILIPALRSARERGQRTVRLSNLKQLTLAWTAYAGEYDGVLVDGYTYHWYTRRSRTVKSWLGTAFLPPQGASRTALIAHPDKGALWPWIEDIDIYRCPRGLAGHAVTYAAVSSANGIPVK